MPRPRVDLESQRDVITALHQAGDSVQSILATLRSQYHIPVGRATLERRIREWGLRSYTQPLVLSPHEERLMLARLYTNFFRKFMNDSAILKDLRESGYRIGSERSIRRIRQKQGLKRRWAREEWPEQERLTTEIVRKALDAHASTELLGRTLLMTNLRIEGYNITRERMFAAVKQLNPLGVDQRRRRVGISQRREFVVPGPDFLWSIDAHCKLEHYGFTVYAMIDAYARYVVCHHVGPHARTKFSVAKQYLRVIQDHGYKPRILRSDHGFEVLLASDIHLQLSRELDGLPFDQCFFYGTSTANQRIESWWAKLGSGCLVTWRRHFEELAKAREWRKGYPADEVALLFVYTPILRRAVAKYTEIWNSHPIRKQNRTPHVRHGRPFQLYEDREADHYSTSVPQELLGRFHEHLASYDEHEFIPLAVSDLCKSIVVEADLQDLDLEVDCTDRGERACRHVYLYLRERLTELMVADPLIRTLPLPDNPPDRPGGWLPSDEVILEFRMRGQALRHANGEQLRTTIEEAAEATATRVAGEGEAVSAVHDLELVNRLEGTDLDDGVMSDAEMGELEEIQAWSEDEAVSG